MIEICEVCDKEIEVEPHKGNGFAIYFCSDECEAEMARLMDKYSRPVRFVETGNGGDR
jgi:hypothetical protein